MTHLSGFDDIDQSAHHRTAEELSAFFEHACAAPSDAGTVEMIVYRPAPGERVVVEEAQLDPDVGVVGDNWSERSSTRTDDGSPHPDMQLNIMNSRVTDAVAGSKDRWALAGDQIYVDFDLSPAALEPWTKLRIGTAIIETTDQPHNGCPKFNHRFGAEALRWVNGKEGKSHCFRGINARVVEAGVVRPGDPIERL